MIYLSTLAPAKVNLVLRVGPRRSDGYHDIQSLMVPLTLADEIEIQIYPGRPGAVTCLCPNHPELEGPSNLAVRAAIAFRMHFGLEDRCRIRVTKRIPITAGLGGGSSDAAAVLRCLSRAYHLRDMPSLKKVGLSVGSDVPFFLGKGSAWVSGRGELVESAQVPPLQLVLAYPRDRSLAIRAANAYRWLDEARANRTGRSVEPAARATRGRLPFRVSHLANDLQVPCFSKHPFLVSLVRRLEAEGAAAAIMSGSGPTVFGLFADRYRALAAELALRSKPGGGEAVDFFVTRVLRKQPRVSSWKSPRSAFSRSMRRSLKPT